MTERPDPMRLAAALDSDPSDITGHKAAAELRRLHEAHDWQYKMAGERLSRLEKAERRITALEQALGMAVEALEYKGDYRNKARYTKKQAALATARQTLGGKHD